MESPVWRNPRSSAPVELLKLSEPLKALYLFYMFILIELSLFIIYVSQGNIFIDPTFAEIIIYKILIHHHQLGFVVSCVVSVSNWIADKNR